MANYEVCSFKYYTNTNSKIKLRKSILKSNLSNLKKPIMKCVVSNISQIPMDKLMNVFIMNLFIIYEVR